MPAWAGGRRDPAAWWGCGGGASQERGRSTPQISRISSPRHRCAHEPGLLCLTMRPTLVHCSAKEIIHGPGEAWSRSQPSGAPDRERSCHPMCGQDMRASKCHKLGRGKTGCCCSTPDHRFAHCTELGVSEEPPQTTSCFRHTCSRSLPMNTRSPQPHSLSSFPVCLRCERPPCPCYRARKHNRLVCPIP